MKIILRAALMALSVGALGVSYLYYRKRKSKSDFLLNYFNPLKNQRVFVVSIDQECTLATEEIKRRCQIFKAVGFDCEWVTVNGKQKPIALLQISTYDGFTVLFRLCKLKYIPDSLKDILEDSKIYKVGVAPEDDSKYLYKYYDVLLESSLDLRHIVQICNDHPGGLAALSKTYLGVTLDKSWKLRCSNWEAETLSEKQVKYAANDSHVSILIFMKLINKLKSSKRMSNKWEDIDLLCSYYRDLSFKSKGGEFNGVKPSLLSRQQKILVSKKKKYPNATRSKPLYDNCFMEAPDGELLCTCDTKKAKWYVEKGLAEYVKEEPLTVRLKFEPSGRAIGEVGQYYKLMKENKCVVCGLDESYIRKNVVPREYRKHFPEIMKDHSSHDVVLLCSRCHQRSNICDLKMRMKLAELCEAPLIDKNNTKFIEDIEAKKIRSAGRALINQGENIPTARCKELENVIKEYFKTDELTPQILMEASELTSTSVNENYESHGFKVFDYFMKRESGLLDLEEMWRQHFLDSMRPLYLPELWSVSHNRERLGIKVREGRMCQEDINMLGLNSFLPIE